MRADLPLDITNHLADGRRAYSIIVPCYNAQATIDRAVQSVLAQSNQDWRLIIVDDGSNDSTYACALRYSAVDSRVMVVRQDNLGVAQARNKGVTMSRSEYVCFLDADDELHPDYLQTMDAFIRRNPGFDVYHPNLAVVDVHGQISQFSAAAEVTSFGLVDLLEQCVIAVGGSVVNRDRFLALGGFRSDIHCEDYDFWLRATVSGARALYLPSPLYTYRQDRRGRRSEDALAGAEGVLLSIDHILENEKLTRSTVAILNDAREQWRDSLVKVAEEQHLARQAEWLRGTLERRLGRKTTGTVLSAAHRITWLTRPLRQAIARTSASRSMKTEQDETRESKPSST